MRVATWNLERPSRRGWKIPPRQRARLELVDADIWVLTETRASVLPGDDYHGLHVPPHPRRRDDEDERWVSIWSRWPLEPTEIDPDPRGTVSAVVHAPSGPVVVYGTVIPWANDPGESGDARMWQMHYEAIEQQGKEWEQLRTLNPDSPLLVAGDFNQSRDGSRWYGTHEGRSRLSDALERADLTCLTEADAVAEGWLATDHLVDHIAASHELLVGKDPGVLCWEKHDAEGVRMSDHPTVAVEW